MTVRRWEKRDNVAIEKIEAASFSDPWGLSALDSCFDTDTFFGLVAEEDGAVIGYVGAVYLFECADVVNVCTDGAFRRKGIAKTLLNQLIDGLFSLGVTQFFLEVRASNVPAITLYDGLGFKKIGVRQKYYENTEDALVYRLIKDE